MEERATGFILRTYPLTETSLIVHWLTENQGRLATVAKGARRPKSPFRGKLDLFFLADFSFQKSRRSELHALREIQLRETFPALRKDLGYLHQAAYCSALIEQITESGTPLPAYFDLLKGLLPILTGQPPQSLTVFAVELKLLAESGLLPNSREIPVTEGSRHIVAALTQLDWPLLCRLKPSAAQMSEINHFIHQFLLQHLDRFPAGRNAALGNL